MQKKITYDGQKVQARLARKIASLEMLLANEQEQNQVIIEYAGELEKQIDELKGGIGDETTD